MAAGFMFQVPSWRAVGAVAHAEARRRGRRKVLLSPYTHCDLREKAGRNSCYSAKIFENSCNCQPGKELQRVIFAADLQEGAEFGGEEEGAGDADKVVGLGAFIALRNGAGEAEGVGGAGGGVEDGVKAVFRDKSETLTPALSQREREIDTKLLSDCQKLAGFDGAGVVEVLGEEDRVEGGQEQL